MDFIEIDGSTEEGGGQILRIALALSSITGKPFAMHSIRAKRPKPGLQPQHLAGVNITSRITNSKTTGAALGSKALAFSPAKIIGGHYDVDIGTAGSVTLLLQTIFPVLLYADRQSQVRIKGGTHVSHSPTIDYYDKVFLPMMRGFGVSAELKTDSFGWFPKGGGQVSIFIKPSRLGAIRITDKGNLQAIRGACSISGLPADITTREEEGMRSLFPGIAVERISKPSLSPGTAVTAWAEFEHSIIGASELGKKGIRAEELGKTVVSDLKRRMAGRSAVDEWMGDQLLIFMALAEGRSRLRVPKITDHMKACMRVVPMFTNVPFEIDGNTIEVDGIGR